MPACFIDGKEYPIELCSTPFVNRWLKQYQNQTLWLWLPAQGETSRWVDYLSDSLLQYESVWKKLGLKEFLIESPIELYNQKRLENILYSVIKLEKNLEIFKKLMSEELIQTGLYRISNLVSLAHEQIWGTRLNFTKTPNAVMKNDGILSVDEARKRWREPVVDIFSLEDWRDSTGFSQSHLELSVCDPGLSPWQCFYKSEQKDWKKMGSLDGNLIASVTLSLRKTHDSAPKDYEQWCATYGLPVIGPRIPLGNFLDNSFCQSVYELGFNSELVITI